MKAISFTMAIACTLVLAGCDKKNADTSPADNNSPAADSTMKFVVEQPATRVCTYPHGVTIPLEVLYIDGKKEKVFLSSNHFPEDVDVTFTPREGIPPFHTVLKVSYSHYAGGKKTVSIEAASQSGVTKQYPFTIDFHGQATAAADHAGTYQNFHYQTSDTSINATGETIVEVGSNYDIINFKNLVFAGGFKESAAASINIYGGGINLLYTPTTSVQGTMTGKGNFTDSTISMYITISPLGGTAKQFKVNLKRK